MNEWQATVHTIKTEHSQEESNVPIADLVKNGPYAII